MNNSGSPPHTCGSLICDTYVSKSPSTNLQNFRNNICNNSAIYQQWAHMVQFHSRYRGIKKVYQLTIQSLPASSQIHQRPIQLEEKKRARLFQGMTVWHWQSIIILEFLVFSLASKEFWHDQSSNITTEKNPAHTIALNSSASFLCRPSLGMGFPDLIHAPWITERNKHLPSPGIPGEFM